MPDPCSDPVFPRKMADHWGSLTGQPKVTQMVWCKARVAPKACFLEKSVRRNEPGSLAKLNRLSECKRKLPRNDNWFSCCNGARVAATQPRMSTKQFNLIVVPNCPSSAQAPKPQPMEHISSTVMYVHETALPRHELHAIAALLRRGAALSSKAFNDTGKGIED